MLLIPYTSTSLPYHMQVARFGMDALEALDEMNRLLDTTDGETVNTSMRLPVALRDAAAPAVAQFGAAPSTCPCGPKLSWLAPHEIQSATSTGAAGAHIGATVRSLPSTEVVVLTSDPADIAAVCSPSHVTIVQV